MALDGIEHVVWVTLENRSFDSLLGWLYPTRPRESFDGLQGLDLSTFTNKAKDSQGREFSCAPIKGASALNVPAISPGEEFEKVAEQMAFDGQTPTMTGFLKNYVNVLMHSGVADDVLQKIAQQVMEAYTPAQLPVINGLAEHYAVCDRWFSSVPSQTNPNRAFSICGTSMGLVSNGFLQTDPRAKQASDLIKASVGDDRFAADTLWNVLYEAGHSDWKIFWSGSMLPEKISAVLDAPGASLLEGLKLSDELVEYLKEVSSEEVESCYTYRLFPHLQRIPDIERHFDKMDVFDRLARSGNLPRFSYIEPLWTFAESSVHQGFRDLFTLLGSDYHPPSNLNMGEAFLKGIYMSLIANRAAWEKTLLIITFDEPVGSFDHVAPPTALKPWGNGESPYPLQSGFQFDRYGARVPAILVSPRIPKGTVFRADANTAPYDHTSVIATLLKWYGAEEKLARFGARAANAPTFEGVVALSQPRTDEGDVRFAEVQQKPGAPLKYYDHFCLRNQYGEYLSAYKKGYTPLGIFSADPELSEYFPTLGGPAVHLYVQKEGDRANPEQVHHGDHVRLISTEVAIGAFNMLGSWKDAHNCYYYNDYETTLDPENARKQTWIMLSSKGQPIAFGDSVAVVHVADSQHHGGQRYLTKHRSEVTTGPDQAQWTVEPVVLPVRSPTPELVRFGGTFSLRNAATGSHLTVADPAHHPTVGRGTPAVLTFRDAVNTGADVLMDGAIVRIALPPGMTLPEGRNVLGTGGFLNKHLRYEAQREKQIDQLWRVVRVAGNNALAYGDQVMLVNIDKTQFMGAADAEVRFSEAPTPLCMWFIERTP